MLSPDLPITKSDDDTLNRGSFAKSLAQVLLQYSFSSSFTIGLYGEWGSGKTSLLNMVLETVENADNSTVILRFNPWLCSDPKQLITQFFKQMAAAIKMKKPAADHAWELIDQYADIFDTANLIPGAGAALAAAGKTLAKEAKKRVEQRTNDLQGSKDLIIEKMAEENLKIVVSIDDIDRLSEEKIIAVFQLVKALADFPNTVYLLAFDYNVVVRALSKVQHGDGREYLEKVIQVPFEIPAPSMTSIHDSLFSKLNAILGDIPEDRWDKVTWSELFQFGLKEYIKSIRDVIRYANVFFLKYELLKNETDPVDLLGLTCLQVFEPTIYSKLPNYKDALCGANEGYSYENQITQEEKVRKTIGALIPDSAIASNIEAVKKILGILFPRIQSISGVSYNMGRYYIHKSFLIANKIAVPACFDRYFSLTLEDDAIPTSIIKQLIYDAEESYFMEGIKRIYQEGKIERLLEEIQAYANKGDSVIIPSERASLIIRCLARQLSSFRVDDTGFLSIPFSWRFLYCADSLLESMDLSCRYPCISSIFEDHDVQPSTLSLLLQDFEIQHGRFTEKAPRENERIITLDEVLELEQIFKKRAIEALDSGTALRHYNGLAFLWMLGLLDAELVASKKKSLIIDDNSLVNVLGYCTSHGTVAEQTVSKIWTIDQNTLGEFIDINEAYQRICTFVKTNEFSELSKDNQMDAVAFLIAMEKKTKTSAIDNHIYEESIQKELCRLTNKEQVNV